MQNFVASYTRVPEVCTTANWQSAEKFTASIALCWRSPALENAYESLRNVRAKKKPPEPHGSYCAFVVKRLVWQLQVRTQYYSLLALVSGGYIPARQPGPSDGKPWRPPYLGPLTPLMPPFGTCELCLVQSIHGTLPKPSLFSLPVSVLAYPEAEGYSQELSAGRRPLKIQPVLPAA